MFKNLKNKTGIKIAGATMTIIFSLAATFSGTIAWFNVSHNASMSAGSFQIVNSNSQLSSVKFYEYHQTSNNKYYFNSTPVGNVVIDGQTATYAASINMNGQYSADDPHHPVLIVLEFSSSGSATIKANRNSPSDPYIGTAAYSPILNAATPSTRHPLSSVVEFFALSLPSITEEGNYVTIPSNDPVFTRKTSKAHAFPEFKDDGEYNDAIDSEVTVFSDSTGGNNYLAIIVDFFPESLEYIYSYYMGHENVSNGLKFSCDWGLSL